MCREDIDTCKLDSDINIHIYILYPPNDSDSQSSLSHVSLARMCPTMVGDPMHDLLVAVFTFVMLYVL